VTFRFFFPVLSQLPLPASYPGAKAALGLLSNESPNDQELLRVRYQWFLSVLFIAQSGWAAQPVLTLDRALETALKKNPRLLALQSEVQALQSSVSGQYAPSAPMVGISQLNRGGSTTYATIAQRLEFPTKYFLKADKQDKLAKAKKHALVQEQYNIRAGVISTYYALHAVEKIVELSRRDLNRLKKVSRIAESKYAAGKAPQHDSMRSHVAQTQAEVRLIELNQERQALLAQLSELLYEDLNHPREHRTVSKTLTPGIPTLIRTLKLNKAGPSPAVQRAQKIREAATAEKRLAAWSLAPDFQVRYQKRIGGEPADSHIVGVEMSIPLWFWGNSSQIASARHKENAASRKQIHTEQRVVSDLRVLKSKIIADHSLLKIFDTSLIPQALSSYNSATAAYRANKIGFVDLLDSERALFQVEIARYRTQSAYVQSLARFEARFGKSLVAWTRTKKTGKASK